MNNLYVCDDTHCLKFTEMPRDLHLVGDSATHITIKVDGTILVNNQPPESDAQVVEALRQWAKELYR